jgi:hypothetical protein
VTRDNWAELIQCAGWRPLTSDDVAAIAFLIVAGGIGGIAFIVTHDWWKGRP